MNIFQIEMITDLVRYTHHDIDIKELFYCNFFHAKDILHIVCLTCTWSDI